MYIVRWMEEPRTSGPVDHPPVLQPRCTLGVCVPVLSDFSFSVLQTFETDTVPVRDKKVEPKWDEVLVEEGSEEDVDEEVV